MTPIDLVAVCTASSPLASSEFAHGWHRLRATIAADVPWVEVAEARSEGLLSGVLSSPVAATLPDNARVLLLAHGHLLLTRGALAQLDRALKAVPGPTAVHAFDSGHPPPQLPDYCTLRGMERYVHRLATSHFAALPDDGKHDAHYLSQDSNPIIISKETFQAVQIEKQHRSNIATGENGKRRKSKKYSSKK